MRMSRAFGRRSWRRWPRPRRPSLPRRTARRTLCRWPTRAPSGRRRHLGGPGAPGRAGRPEHTAAVEGARGVKVVVLSGGVGGARFVRGLVESLPPADVTVIGNVGDDVEVLGVHVSPDLDSILYALAGLNDEERGWGRAGETWNALETVSGLGGEDWFRLGDRDLGLHLVRTQALRAGVPLSAVTR